MTQPCLCCVATMLVGSGILMLSAWPLPALAFQLGTWKGYIETTGDLARDDGHHGSDAVSRTQTALLQERLTLRNDGAFIYDPRLTSFAVQGTFGLAQSWCGVGDRCGSWNGTLWGYDTSARILTEKPYSLQLFATRDHSTTAWSLTGGANMQAENRGAVLLMNRFLVPSMLSFRQERRHEQPLPGGTAVPRDERRTILSYQGQRGWLNGEMDVSYEFVDAVDGVYPNLSYRKHEAGLEHSLDFGAELDRHWDSRLRLMSHRGVTDITRWTVDELLQIDHAENLRTQARYSLTHFATLAGATTTHTGEASVRHRLYESLATTLALDSVLQVLSGGRRQAFGGRLDFAYTKRLPGEGRLNIGPTGAFHYEDSRIQSTESFVPQETITFGTPFAVPVGLKNPFVVASTITVTKVASGPLPPGCTPPSSNPLPLALGQDFEIRTANDITEIVPIPCSGAMPGINPGDTIAVDYRFSVSPSMSFTTAAWGTNVGVDYRWIRLYFSHEHSDQRLVSGHDGQFLDAKRTDAVGAELRRDGRRLRASLLVEGRRFSSQRQSGFRSIRSSQLLSYSTLNDMTISLGADQAIQDYENPRRRTQSLAGRVSLIYNLDTSLFVDGNCVLRWYRDPLSPTEQTTEALLRIRWSFRQLEVRPTLAFVHRRRGGDDLKEYRAALHVFRRF